MQYLFHIAPGAGEAVAVPVERLEELRKTDGWLWLDISEFTAADVERVGKQFGFDALEMEDVLDWSKFPKVEERNDHTLVVGHALSASGSPRLETVEYDAFIGDKFLVTFHSEDLLGFMWGRHHAVVPGVLEGVGPDILWARMAETGAAHYRPLVEGLDQRIEELENRAIAADPTVPADVLALRRDSQILGQVISAQRDAFRILSGDELPGITRQGRRRLTHVFDDYSRLSHTLESAPLLLISVLESFRGTIAERANEVMKVLTVFSAIVLPLSLIAGIYGMNFRHMPELLWRYGYLGAMILMLIVGVGLWVYFGRRGFVGGPRFGAVPRVVGRGLVEFVKVTTKPISMVLDVGRNGSPDEDKD